MNTPKEPHSYFMGNRLIFVVISDSDKPINPNTRDPETNQLIYTKPKGSERGSFDSNGEAREDGDTGDDEKLYNKKIDDLIIWSNEVAKGIRSDLRIERSPENEVVHFLGTRNAEPVKKRNEDSQAKPKTFSLISASVHRAATAESGEKDEQFISNELIIELVMSFDQALKRQPYNRDAIRLVTLMPNWLFSPCSEVGGGGGPGGIPEPYRGRPDDPHPFDFSHKPGLQEALKKAGEGVTVAILDTAPCLKDLADIYERYHKVNPAKQKEHHPLIEGLNDRLEVHPASYEDLHRMRAVHLRDHDYHMTDHGLFVAGIIHSIVPAAEIHLYEVLNSQGVGDLMSIAQGFWRILNRFAGKPLVVNCSLMLNFPLLNQPIADLEPALMAKIIKDWEKHKDEKWLTADLLSEDGKEWLARQSAVIEWICDLIRESGSLVIAAAGNDWRPEELSVRPDPRQPAAFDSVLGVGALPKNALPDAAGLYRVSRYSNISDKPEPGSTEEEVGIVTLGGEAGEGNGVLGVYIGQFPDMKYRLDQYHWLLRPIMWVIFTLKWGNCIRPRNESHWAWWCGTSFATPIIAGLTAAMLSVLNQPATTQAAIDAMYASGVIKEKLTAYEEDGVEGVKQA